MKAPKLGNRGMISDLISSLLILLFVYTAGSKLVDFEVFRATLDSSPLVGDMAILLSWLLPISELLLALLLFIPKFRVVGLYGSFILMSIFTLYIGYLLVFKYHALPCSCGGVIKNLTWTQHLIFNILFIALAFIGIVLEKKKITLINEATSKSITFT